MNKRLWYVMVAGALVSVQGYAAKEKVVRFTNHVRVGYDDNIDANADENETGYLTNVSQLTGKFVFSSRSELMLFWQPEFRYRFDADPKFVSYQDLYARLDHAISQRVFLTLSDRFRYQDRDAQEGAGLVSTDQNYLENDLKGALSFTVTPISDIKVGAGYLTRIWDDDAYGEVQGNNFDRFTGDASYVRQFFSEKTDAMIGVNAATLDYDGSRGGYDSWAALIGLDQTFSSKSTAFARLGVQTFTVEDSNGVESDSTSPYLQGGFDYLVSDRTSFNGALGYSLSQSENSYFNAQDRFNVGVGARHDFTSKINVAANLSYVYSMYDADYASGILAVEDTIDQFVSLSIRGTYQFNRNNFLELGYIYNHRGVDTDAIPEYDRNRVEMGWKLRL